MVAGLHCIGAISSLGKTTFVLQMAENMAQIDAASGLAGVIFAWVDEIFGVAGLDEASTVPIVGGIIDAMKPYTAPLKYVLEMLIPDVLIKE